MRTSLSRHVFVSSSLCVLLCHSPSEHLHFPAIFPEIYLAWLPLHHCYHYVTDTVTLQLLTVTITIPAKEKTAFLRGVWGTFQLVRLRGHLASQLNTNLEP